MTEEIEQDDNLEALLEEREGIRTRDRNLTDEIKQIRSDRARKAEDERNNKGSPPTVRANKELRAKNTSLRRTLKSVLGYVIMQSELNGETIDGLCERMKIDMVGESFVRESIATFKSDIKFKAHKLALDDENGAND